MYAIHLSQKLCRAAAEMVFTQEMQRVDRDLHLSSPIPARRSGNGELIGVSAILFCFVYSRSRHVALGKINALSTGLTFQTSCCSWNYFDNSEIVSTNGSLLAFKSNNSLFTRIYETFCEKCCPPFISGLLLTVLHFTHSAV